MSGPGVRIKGRRVDVDTERQPCHSRAVHARSTYCIGRAIGAWLLRLSAVVEGAASVAREAGRVQAQVPSGRHRRGDSSRRAVCASWPPPQETTLTGLVTPRAMHTSWDVHRLSPTSQAKAARAEGLACAAC
eukprot:scaffold17023_cov32-Tisochrysis_lutea.AAC.6